MSLTFTRRSFLKYTALAAAAVAGSGLLTGCGGTFRPVGGVGDTLELMGKHTLKSAQMDRDGSMGFVLSIGCISGHSQEIDEGSFDVNLLCKDGSKKPLQGAVFITPSSFLISKGETREAQLWLNGTRMNELLEGVDTEEAVVEIRFWPINRIESGYTIDSYCTWNVPLSSIRE